MKFVRQIALVGLASAMLSSGAQPAASSQNTGMADPVALINAFDRYLRKQVSGTQTMVMPLVTLRGLTSESLNASGNVTIDLVSGSVMSQVNGLPPDGAFDLWLLQNRAAPGETTMAQPQDRLLWIGTYPQGNTQPLRAMSGGASFATFLPDRAFVVRSGQSPLNTFVLTGSSPIFDRLMRRQVRFVDEPGAALGFDPVEPATRAGSFARLVAQGRQLFVNEQFNGNGRRCGTCHVETNNFTIDPAFIAALPRTDPLFVAETNPALAIHFEKPDLMRRFGLFVENADGYDDVANKFTLRSAQNVQALTNSTVRPDPSLGMDFSSNGLNADPPERLGWGNDGAPLREFALVAIGQHATKTLNRRPGVDFRVPTDQELDALAAYQLALGRQEDFSLPTLVLNSGIAAKGKILYLDTGNIGEPGHKNCNACHFNAGGTSAVSFNTDSPGFPRLDSSPLGFNMGAPTNVNEIPLALELGLPRDGGFGVLPLPGGGFGNFFVVGGQRIPFEEFNTPPLVESADTPPFFHNHTVKDLESAIAFYGTPAFQSPKSIGNPGAIPIRISADPKDPEVQAIAAFLRVLNALENIRSSINVAERGRTMASEADAHDLARLAFAETSDAIKVLSEGALAKNIEPSILAAGSGDRGRSVVAGCAIHAAPRYRQCAPGGHQPLAGRAIRPGRPGHASGFVPELRARRAIRGTMNSNTGIVTAMMAASRHDVV
jgi:cytochrome c peroxidase